MRCERDQQCFKSNQLTLIHLRFDQSKIAGSDQFFVVALHIQASSSSFDFGGLIEIDKDQNHKQQNKIV